MDKGQVILYQTPDGESKIEVRLENDTVWLSADQMAELFQRNKSTISRHVKNVLEDGELEEASTVAFFATVQNEGDRKVERKIAFYNLDMIISVGYRVHSHRGVQFRIWATKVLKDFIVKGFVLDDERLKGKTVFGEDYFEELLDRIREIRTSERRYYQKITDIYAECSYDYDKNSETTRLFYKTVQNMMHYAVTHQTAAEIVYDRANAEKPYMGLTTWKNAPEGRIRKSDVTIAKNYLSEKEVRSLELLSTAFVDIAELRAERQQLMSMKDWKEQLVKFLSINDHDILPDAGRISHEQAEEKALGEYEKYRVIQDQMFLSDFDRLLDELK